MLEVLERRGSALEEETWPQPDWWTVTEEHGPNEKEDGRNG